MSPTAADGDDITAQRLQCFKKKKKKIVRISLIFTFYDAERDFNKTASAPDPGAFNV